MSTSVPILSDENLEKVVLWMRDEMKRREFDPQAAEFQAAIALVAANDQYRQDNVLSLLHPENISISYPSNYNEDTVTTMMRVSMFRYLTRHYQISPQFSRAAFHAPSSENPLLSDESSYSLEFLTPHKQPLESTDPFDVFKHSFQTGEGQPAAFMAERRHAILSSTQFRSKLTKDYSSTVIDPEIKKIAPFNQQVELRKKLVKFCLDPLSENLPAYEHKLLQHKREQYMHVSPQHVGIINQYDISSNADRSKKKSRLNIILQRANQFKINLNNKFKLIGEVNKSLIERNKMIEKDEKRKTKNSDYIRLQALKKNNIQEYRRLVNEMKDSRIQLLLERTDSYMKELSDKIKTTHTTVEGKDENQYELEINWPDYVTQPTCLVGTLKDYQLKGLQWLVSLYNSHLNGILADEMGLGKTIQTIALLAWLMENKKDFGPHLICAPLSTLSNWKNEFSQWLPIFNVVSYTGNQAERRELERVLTNRSSNVNAVLTSYEFVIRDKSVLGRLDYSYMVIDEAHKLKNHQGKLSQALSHSYSCKNRLLLTGTPLQNNQKELWSLLNFVLPNIFNDHSKFEEWFAAPFGKASENVQLNQEEQWLIINRLHAVLRPFIFRRSTAQVASELPTMVENKILCNMSAWQKQMYKTLVDESSIIENSEGGPRVVRVDNVTMQLRKVCNHPYLFSDVYYLNADFVRAGGKFEILDRILPKLKRTGHRVLIFSQMTEVLNLLEDLMKWLDFKYSRLDGTTKGDQRQQLIKDFNAPDSEYFVFLLSTRAGGLGLNLQTADTVILYDNDWNPFQDQQARSRVHRIGQEKQVLVLSLVTMNSIEERVLDRADQKKSLETKIIEVGQFNDTSNLDDRKKLYQQVIDQSSTVDQGDVHDDEEINRIIARSPEELEIFKQMDLERTRKYQREWEESGHKGKYPRLMTYDELPDYLKIPFSELVKDDDLPTIRKSRSSNFSAKLENMTDNEYARLIDRGENPEEHVAEIAARKEQMKALLKQVGELCGPNFDTLPSRAELPVYYEVISQPITLEEIRTRYHEGEYLDVSDLVADLRLMASNAMRFNDKSTIFYITAEQIMALTGQTAPQRELPSTVSMEF